MTNYADVKIPTAMAKDIDERIRNYPRFGFRSRAQYVANAIREFNFKIDENESKNKKSKNSIDPNQTKTPIKNIFKKDN